MKKIIDWFGYNGTIKGKPKQSIIKKNNPLFNFMGPANKKIGEPNIGLYSKQVYWTHKGGDKKVRGGSSGVDNYFASQYAKKFTELGRYKEAHKGKIYERKEGAVKEATQKLIQLQKSKNKIKEEYQQIKRPTKQQKEDYKKSMLGVGRSMAKTNKTLGKKKLTLEEARYEQGLEKLQKGEMYKKLHKRTGKRLTEAFIPMGGMKAAIKIRPDKSTVKQETQTANRYFEQNQYQQQVQRQRNLGGRPTGSYTHSIPGKGLVSVYEYRRWLGEQKRLQRERASQLGSQAPEQMQQQMSQEEMQMQNEPQPQEQVIYNQNEAQTVDQLPQDNKFTKQLQFQKSMYNREQYARLVNEQPKGFVQQTVRDRQILAQQQREFSRRNNILNAHKHMLTPQENMIDFADINPTEPTILDTRNNNIMVPTTNQIDILNTGRPNVLQAQGLPDVSNQNIMNAQRLNFGKIDLTGEQM